MRTFFSQRLKRLTYRGFTLVELLVVMAIFTLITTLILVSTSKFNSNTAIRNLAYDIALIVRQAQVYGVASREFGAGSGIFSYRYGIHFDSNNPSTIIMFADANNNNGYDGESEQVDIFTIRNGNSISLLCATPAASTEVCLPTITRLDVLFMRPNPDALIYTNMVGVTYERARIQVIAPNTTTRELVIYSTGQISIQ